MQRVAIARALVNNPDILLADEPTGALDSKTSLQIMDLLKEIAKDRLVIMVTHNPELANKYSTRIVKLKDGSIISIGNDFEIKRWNIYNGNLIDSGKVNSPNDTSIVHSERENYIVVSTECGEIEIFF